MNNNPKLLILLTMLTGQLSLNANSAINYLYNSPWEFIEDKLINSAKTSSAEKVSQAALSSILGFGAFQASDLCIEEYNKTNDPEISENPSKCIKLASSASTTALGLAISQYILKYKAQHKALERFMSEWPTNKKFTPHELHRALDIAYENYISNHEQFKEESDKLLELIQKQISRQFPEKYKTSKIKKYLIPKVLRNSFHLCLGTFAKWTTDIIWSL